MRYDPAHLMGVRYRRSVIIHGLKRTWSADCPEESCVELAQCVKAVVRDVFAMFLVVCRSPWDMSEVNIECSQCFGKLFHHLNGGADHFGADTVTRDGCNTIRVYHFDRK